MYKLTVNQKYETNKLWWWWWWWCWTVSWPVLRRSDCRPASNDGVSVNHITAVDNEFVAHSTVVVVPATASARPLRAPARPRPQAALPRRRRRRRCHRPTGDTSVVQGQKPHSVAVYFPGFWILNVFNSPNIGSEIQANVTSKKHTQKTQNRRFTITYPAGKSSRVMQSNVSNKQTNSRGFGINKFCVASGNLVARKFEIKLFTIKFNGWHAVSLVGGVNRVLGFTSIR